MTDIEIQAYAYEEAQRLLEKSFSFYNPYSCEIYDEEIPFVQRERFYKLVEEELKVKGEKINRRGAYFKIQKYNN